MGWLVFALAMGVVLGIAVRLSQTVMRFLDRSLTVSLVVMLQPLGLKSPRTQNLNKPFQVTGF